MTDALDQWEAARGPKPDQTEAPVTADELARTLHTFVGTPSPIPWDDLDDATKRRLTHQARRALEHLSTRRMTDAHKLALARLRNAADSIAESTHEAVDEALRDAGLRDDDVRRDGWKQGLRYVIEELDAHGISDTIGGATRLDDALRAFEREAR